LRKQREDREKMIFQRTKAHTLLDKLRLSDTTTLLLSAAVVGAGTGFGAVFFIKLIAYLNSLFFVTGGSLFSFLGVGIFVVVPVVGGLLSGPVITYFANEAKGHGVPEVMQAIALKGGRIRPRVVVAKVVASALCLGSGGSAGREGPIVQVGSALGSTIGQWLHLSETRIRNLVACGAAAGIAATFNAPIAGVIFAMEIILGELHLGDLGNVVISAITASTVARIFLGDNPAFTIPNYDVKTPWEIILYLLLGVFAAIAAVGIIRMLYWMEDLFDNWKFPDALKPAVGGLLLGTMGMIYMLIVNKTGGVASLGNGPAMFGPGLDIIEQAFVGKIPILLLAALIFLKPLSMSFTLGSGSSGGVFAPSLFTGAALGGVFGWAVNQLIPGMTSGPAAFAIVGMAAVFAGAARAPFTAILIVFEMTTDYDLILPLMAAVIVSLIISSKMQKESIYTLKLARKGINLKRGIDLDLMETVRVDEVMVSEPASVLFNMPVSMLASKFLETGRHGFPVLDKEGNLIAMVSLEDYRRATADEKRKPSDLTIADIATRTIVSVFPDETVGIALQRMAPRDLSRLPVVSRQDPRKLVGIVRRNDIVRAYDLGSVRREEARLHAANMQNINHKLAQFVEVRITDECCASGQKIADLALPYASVIVSVQRGHDLIIPHGDTTIEPGDMITVLCESDAVADVQKAITG